MGKEKGECGLVMPGTCMVLGYRNLSGRIKTPLVVDFISL